LLFVRFSSFSSLPAPVQVHGSASAAASPQHLCSEALTETELHTESDSDVSSPLFLATLSNQPLIRCKGLEDDVQALSLVCWN
ncbi:hypothetical protein LINPERHAP2_LOCUS7330, partial [Linum perenne]